MWHKNLYLRPIPKRGHILKDKVDQEQMGGVEVIFLGENSPDSKAWIVGSTCLSFTAWVTEHHLLVPINCHPPSVRRGSVNQWETKTTALGGEMGQGPSCRLWPPSAAACPLLLPSLRVSSQKAHCCSSSSFQSEERPQASRASSTCLLFPGKKLAFTESLPKVTSD